MPRGVTLTGFSDPTFVEIRDSLRTEWLTQTGFTVKEGKPEDDLINLLAERISNRGLVDSATLEKAMWQGLKEVFFNSFIDTGSGLGLSLAGEYRNISPTPALKSVGHLVFNGVAGTMIPLGTKVVKSNDVNVVAITDREITIGASGVSVVPATMVSAGNSGNVGRDMMTVVSPSISGITSVGNTNATNTLNISNTVDSYFSLSNNNDNTNYFVLDTSLLLYPVNFESLTMQFRNPDSATRIYDLQLGLYDDVSGAVISLSGINTVSFAPNESKQVKFDSIFIDVQLFPNIRISVLNIETSDGSVEIGLETVGSSGGWYINNVNQPTSNLWALAVSSIGGEFSGGSAAQSDISFKQQFKNVLFNGAGATPNGLFSKLSALPNTRVKIQRNPFLVSRKIGTGLTLPPKSVAAIVDTDVSPNTIASTIASSGGGLLSVGDVSRAVTQGGTTENISFYFARRELIDVRVKLTRLADFPATGVQDIKDEIISYIGGFDSANTKQIGLDIGAPVSHSEIVQRVKNAVQGIKFADIRIALTGQQPQETYVDIAPLKRAWTDSSLIQVS